MGVFWGLTILLKVSLLGGHTLCIAATQQIQMPQMNYYAALNSKKDVKYELPATSPLPSFWCRSTLTSVVTATFCQVSCTTMLQCSAAV